MRLSTLQRVPPARKEGITFEVVQIQYRQPFELVAAFNGVFKIQP